MSISIVACPKCGTFLLNDTAQCHRCRFVINPELATQFRDTSLPTDAAIQQDMERCRQCGETCRKGLVRCWSCGAFTRPEIEAAYYRLLQGHSPAANTANQKYELPEISAEQGRAFWGDEDKAAAAAAASSTPVATSELTASDDDFELTGNLHLLEEAQTLGTNVSEADAAAENGEPDESIIKMPEIPAAASASETPPASAEKPAAATAKTAVGKTPAAAPSDDPDALLSIAKQQESDTQKSRKAKLGEGFVIYCPMGCKIRVQEKHRGKIGRCPKCNATFVVPMARQTSVSGSVPPGVGENAASAATSAAPTPSTAQKYGQWMQDIHLHKVIPQKLRIKTDSLLNDFQEVDLAFDPAGILMVAHAAGGGLFGGKDPKKKAAARTAVTEHLATKGTTEGLPASFKQELARDAVSGISLSQPPAPGAESLFGDVLVFGAGRIAVRLPKFDDKMTAYLSFSLSQFREFSRLLAEFYSIDSFGSGAGIPLRDEYQDSPCHFTKKPVKELKNLVYYEKDPSIKREISGYRCKTCQTIISETARAGQKLGGADGKGIAKVKCPKCSKPLGNQPLYKVSAAAEPASAEPDPAATAPSADKKTPEAAAV